MIRTHVSRSKDAALVVRAEPVQDSTFKPKGFWYSVDGGWEEWCKSEMPHWIEGLPAFRVTLGDERLIEIRSVLDIDLFHMKYRVTDGDRWQREYINWAKVAQDFDGIEIAPYQWNRRLEGPPHHWYYSWDCASGCIWRPNGVRVERIEPINVVKVPDCDHVFECYQCIYCRVGQDTVKA